MTWTAILDVLADLGAATAYSLWLPVLMWTAVVLPAWVLLAHSSAHPLAQYRLRQMLLAALPLGLIATALVDASGWLTGLWSTLWPASSGSVTAGSAVVIPNTASSTGSTTAPLIWSWTQAVGAATLIALGGALVGLGRLTRDVATFLRLRRSVETDSAPDLQVKVDTLRRRLRIRRPIRVEVTKRDVVPMTLAGWPVTLVLPSRLTDRPEALRMTLLHECIHVRRRDDLAHVAERLVAAVFTAIPYVGWLQQSIMHYREQACDAAVLDDHATRASSYAELLVAFADRAASSRTAMLSLSESPSSLKQRLHAMKRHVAFPSVRWISGLAVALLVAVTLGIVACSDSIAPPTSDEEPLNPQQSLQELAVGDDPLYIVDGEERESVDGLDNDDIASIEVLKGDAVPDKYAERAATGVIHITTKQDTTGKTTPSLSSTKNVLPMDDPLFVVDGETQESIEELNPEDIDSIEVLKGDAATDEYGERGADGVVVITTKQNTTTGDAAANPPTSEETFVVVEQQPDCGGVKALQQHVQYPEFAQKAGIEGRVFVQFVVNENGDVINPKVTRGVHRLLNEAALNAVKQLNCKPGTQRGEAVKVRMALPVTFRLDDGSEGETTSSSATSGTNSGGTLFEKAGIQVVRVLMNENGDLLLDDEPVEVSNLTDAVRQRITKDAARAALLYADGAPTDRVNAVEARLKVLDLQKVYVRKVGQPPPTKNSESRHSSGTDVPESAQLNVQFQPNGTPVVNGTPMSIDRIQHVADRWRSRVVRLNDDVDLSIHMDGDAPFKTRTRVWAQIQNAFPGPNVPYIPANV